jgi:hypothetical protein
MTGSGRSPPWLGSYSVQGKHKHETDGREAHRRQEGRRVSHQRMQDGAVRVKDSTDDGETWSKRSTRTRRLARRKETMIGGAMRRLAAGERMAAAYLCFAKTTVKGRKLQLIGGIYSRRRETSKQWARMLAKGRRRQAGPVAPLACLVSPVLGR